ncbi:MAG: bifunctional aspartate kinase/homoserine dehydrogenase I, partial [Bacteroidota bacterium]
NDVRRKILILARESGWPLEAKDVIIDELLPTPLNEAATVDSFFELLPEYDQHFDELRLKAAKENKVLRIIASLDEKGRARIALEAVGTESPFYFLSGSDNMIAFRTERYKDRPLVVRGPGAGAEVTAAGVFAEIISIGSFLN